MACSTHGKSEWWLGPGLLLERINEGVVGVRVEIERFSASRPTAHGAQQHRTRRQQFGAHVRSYRGSSRRRAAPASVRGARARGASSSREGHRERITRTVGPPPAEFWPPP
eukprot:COSAG02_NODE_4504_length_5285_cov_2.849402_1_plen_110_part_10